MCAFEFEGLKTLGETPLSPAPDGANWLLEETVLNLPKTCPKPQTKYRSTNEFYVYLFEVVKQPFVGFISCPGVITSEDLRRLDYD